MRESDLTENEVLHAASTLVEAFGSTDTGAYFDCFTEDASFVFYTEASRFDSRAAYERVWAQWLAEGWSVAGCSSTNHLVQLLGSTAVFTHDVVTTTSTGGAPETTRERETIVFRRTDRGVQAVHEHLSPLVPSPEASTP
jgi:ketosteroid isomerase-like protein